MKYFLIALVSLLTLPTCTDHNKDNSAEKQDSLFDSLNIELNELAATEKIPGFAVAVVNRNGPIFQKTYGYANLEANLPYTKETAQLIASVSKTFIGVALMQLVEQGKIKLDDPINKYLPFTIRNTHHPEIDITIRMLATHTSSIDDYDDGEESVYWLLDPIPEPRSSVPKDVLSRLEYFERGQPITLAQSISYALPENGKWYDIDNFLSSEPGSEMMYSNIGASLTAYIIELVSDQSFESFTNENIFQPLQMNNTAWHHNELNNKVLSTTYITYEENEETKTFPLPRNEHGDYPDGGMLTNIIDLSKYISEMIKGINGDGKLLSPTGYNILFTPQLDKSHFPDGRSDNIFNDEYNYGVFWGRNHDGYIMHNGFDDGVTANVMINPQTGIGTIAFSNIGDNIFGEVLQIVSVWEQKMK